jgi:thioredoxin reductase
MPICGFTRTVVVMNEHDIDIDWDVIIVGRSYAGLSTALTLGRARWATLLVGEGGPRNEAVRHVHGLLTRDGADPAEIVRIAEDELARYETVQIATDHVGGIERIDGGFRVHLGPSTSTARAVVLATGVNDNPPAVAGLSEHWGRGVFTCPFCDGFERADRPWVLITDEAAPQHVTMLGNWASSVAVHTPDEVRRVHGDGEEVTHVELVDGTKLEAAAVFVGQTFTPNNRLALDLGCAVDERGLVVVDAMNQTTVDGVYAIGDLTRLGHHMSHAIADGTTAAAAITHRLLTTSA